MAIILFIIVMVFVFVVIPPKNKVRPFSIEFIVFLAGVLLIWLVLRTRIVEEITSDKFLQIMIKTILAIVGMGIIVFSYSLQ